MHRGWIFYNIKINKVSLSVNQGQNVFRTSIALISITSYIYHTLSTAHHLFNDMMLYEIFLPPYAFYLVKVGVV